MEQKLWFKAKRFGWGWYPVTWQGWGILAMYLLGAIPEIVFLQDMGPYPLPALVRVIILTAFLIIICYVTGERPRWRWGK